MFWKQGNTSSSQIEIILAKQDVTLQELMDEEDIINECKLQNKSLMEFLVKPEIIEELITLTTVEPSADLDECTRFKYSNIACEILTCDAPKINERLAGDVALLSKLYTFVDSEPPLNPLLASFFSKIMSLLIARNPVQNWISYHFTCLQVLDFLKAKENFIPVLLKHLSTSAIMDLTLKLMTQVEVNEVRQNNLNWLDSQQLMQSLVSLLDPAVDSERHYNVAQLLCDFISTSRENLRSSTIVKGPDPLLNTLESPETVSLLLDHMLSEPKKESCIVGGIQVLLALLDVNKSSDKETSDIEQKQRESTIHVIVKRLKDFHSLLLDPPKKRSINTMLGILDPPLGNTRLQVTKLIATLISTNNLEFIKELILLGTLQVLLDLFFAFPWNNFLHTQVQSCLVFALKAPIPSGTDDEDIALYKHLIVKCKLIERILDAWKYNDAQELEKKSVRQGYMGHLTEIANSIAETCSSTSLGQFLQDNLPETAETFKNFSETTLKEILNTRAILLGGVHPSAVYPNAVNEASDECGDAPYSQSNALNQQMFTQYQMHQLSPQFIDNYVFTDEDFNALNDTLQAAIDETLFHFNLSEGVALQPQELFKQVCAQHINTLDDADDQIFEDKDHTFETVIEKQGEHNDTVYSSDSEEEDSPPPDDAFTVVDGWPNKDSETAVTPVTMGSVWNNSQTTATEANTGWANFSSASFANFEANFGNATSDIEETGSKKETDSIVENIENCKNISEGEDHTVIKNANEDFAQFVSDISKTSDNQIEMDKQTCEINNVLVNATAELSIGACEGDCKLETGSSVKTTKETDQEGI
ncbi:hypothetical protein RN001_009740 [Aquatica leii]|uniref:Serine/threonine-protein phosphatase 6 regulatory subunit 3 n=1 Tax=Aquatica leii TaxID=1421715 RepID=A0AAN7PU25_9COLE|nr:hypothetical protein RN001_009740 [Aquatica leii]